MYERIVVGFDDRAEGLDALQLGALIARITGAELTVASVFPYTAAETGAEELERALEIDSAPLFERAQQEAKVLGLKTVATGARSPARALHDLAEGEDVDLIVLGSSHRGSFGRILPGSVASRLLHGAPCAVAVAPRGFARREAFGLGVIGAAYDGSPEAGEALSVAAGLAGAEGASLKLLTVIEPPPLFAGYGEAIAMLSEESDALLEAGLKAVAADVPASGEVLRGEAGAALARACESGVDLIVVGSRGYGPVRRVLLGSASSKLVQEAPCPVLVVPRGRLAKRGDWAPRQAAAELR